MAQVTKVEREQAIERLRGLLKDNDEVFIVNVHTSSSGMSRVLRLYTIRPSETGSDVRWLAQTAAEALGWRYDAKRDGIVAQGCGMDMGFHTVYELGGTLGLKLTHRWL